MIRFSYSFLFLSIFCITACEKAGDFSPEDWPAGTSETVKAFSSQFGNIQSASLMVQEVMLAYTATGSNGNGSLPACAVITPDPVHKTIKIDFGTGCSINGFVLKGSCTVSYSGNFGQEGSVMSALFLNLGLNDMVLNGKLEFKDFIKKGTQVEYRLVTTELTLLQGSDTYVFNIELHQNWKSGYNTTSATDNEILTEINGSYKEAGGAIYAVTTKTSLLTLGNCTVLTYPVPLSGILDMVPNTGPKITLDFGAGTCDAIVKVTTAGKSKDVDLSK